MMWIHPAIQMGLGLCSLLLVYVACEERLRKILPRGMTACLVMCLLNVLLPQEWAIRITFVNMAFVFLLGLPGVGMMYFIKWLMWII